MFHRCHKHGKRVCVQCFVWSVGFLIEHFVWEKLPGFRWVTHALGL